MHRVGGAPGATRPQGSDVSEYYERRRAITADASSFVFFVLGFLSGGAYAWPVLRASFENGAPDRGLAIFIAWLFGGGLVAGVCGYMLGTVAGRLWQAWHQWRRGRRGRRAPAASPALGTQGAASSAQELAVGTPPEPPRHAPGPMSCRVGPLTPSIYAVFARRVAGDAHDRRYMEAASTEILTLAAWDGLDVAGVARLLSDGYGALFITDITVDPHYVASDVEATLIDFARRRVPAGGRLTRV
ncbi:MAG: hypothetical protein ACYC3L_03335 [Gemmatimonadaceae bacterium]